MNVVPGRQLGNRARCILALASIKMIVKNENEKFEYSQRAEGPTSTLQIQDDLSDLTFSRYLGKKISRFVVMSGSFSC
ncbi:MAG: hypothetical protein DMG93_00100 [Acidobacteria bacterium]|nr:MAG: hypothetical protein DMG93_00100 [Acidobacteriota bacterium]